MLILYNQMEHMIKILVKLIKFTSLKFIKILNKKFKFKAKVLKKNNNKILFIKIYQDLKLSQQKVNFIKIRNNKKQA